MKESPSYIERGDAFGACGLFFVFYLFLAPLYLGSRQKRVSFIICLSQNYPSRPIKLGRGLLMLEVWRWQQFWWILTTKIYVLYQTRLGFPADAVCRKRPLPFSTTRPPIILVAPYFNPEQLKKYMFGGTRVSCVRSHTKSWPLHAPTVTNGGWRGHSWRNECQLRVAVASLGQFADLSVIECRPHGLVCSQSAARAATPEGCLLGDAGCCCSGGGGAGEFSLFLVARRRSDI